MNTLLVVSPQPGAGKTGVLAALALQLAYEGRRVLALRLGADDDAAAVADAEFLAMLPFARGRGGRPVSAEQAVQVADDGERPLDLLLLEAPGGDGSVLSALPDARVLAVVRGDPRTQGESLAGAAQQIGGRFAGVVATALPARQVDAARAAREQFGLAALAVLAEDQTLYAPTIADLLEALDAELILGDPPPDQIVEHMLIGPLTPDPSDPYFKRRRNKAVITRSDKTDLQLSALHAQTNLLILTGGYPPSPYTIDRAAGEEVPILLTRADTRQAIGLLSDVFGVSRFSGERKLERMAELLGGQWDIAEMNRVAGLAAMT
jgi:BioD-like phosphotransacetylase family protein